MKTFLRGPRVAARYFVYALALSFTLLGSAACGGDDDDAAANAAQGSATGGAVTDDDIISLLCRPVKWVSTDVKGDGDASERDSYYWMSFRTDGTLVDGLYKDGAYSTNTDYNTWSLNLNTKELTIVYYADASDPDKIDVDRYTIKSVTANVAVLIDDFGDEQTYVAR